MEVFSEDAKCNRLMGNIPPLRLGGHSVNLLDNYLVIAASGISYDGWWYHSLENARRGLLANPWKHTKTLGNDYPIHHVSFVYGKDLVLLGGEKGIQLALQNAREENGEWNSLGLTLQKDGSNFDHLTQDACVVKVTKDTFFVLGGRQSTNGPAMSTVFSINMREKNVQEVGSLKYPRAQHACAVIPGPTKDFNNKHILVTGGTTHGDEIFNVTLKRSRVLDNAMNIPRINHVLVTLGHKVFALGGQREASCNDSALGEIEVFDADSESWSLHSSKLLSKSTDGLAVTELPSSAVSCIQDCQCGVKAGARIVGGTEAQVKLMGRELRQQFFQDPAHPWLGLLLTSGETDIAKSSCAAILVGFKTSSTFRALFPADWRQHVPHRRPLSGKLLW